MKRLFTTLLLLLLLTHSSRGQNEATLSRDSVLKKIVEQVVIFPQEKLHLQLDKPVYISGEKIWFRAWLVDAVLHKPVINQYVIVELINPIDSVVNRVKIRQSQGALSGYLPLNEGLPEGDYTVCAFTENQLNLGSEFIFKKNIHIVSPLSATLNTNAKFSYETGDKISAEVSFEDIKTQKKIKPEGLRLRINTKPFLEGKVRSDTVAYFSFQLPESGSRRILYLENKKWGKFISIPYQQEDYDVTFYPEGGYLLSGVNCNVAFKALDSGGLPENITGRIVDSIGNEYSRIETTHDGMGLFSLVSNEGVTYYADCKDEQGKEKRFKLPQARKETSSLQVKSNQKTLLVSVLNSSDVKQQGKLFLILHTRGIIHYASQWDYNYNTISFDTEKFPSGVLQILLLDFNMNPLSERLVFCHNNDMAKVKFGSDRQNYTSRQMVNSRLKITDFQGMPLEGSLSVSVTDDNDLNPDTLTNIMTTLLLTSELKGYINNLAYYFQDNNPESVQSLDLLMLTNGWRRYSIPDVIKGKYETPNLPEKQGMEITGKVKRLLLDKMVEKGKVAIFSWEVGYYDETETDSNGRFAFNRIEFPDSSTFVIQALNKMGSKGVELLIDRDNFPRVLPIQLQTNVKTEKTEEKAQLNSYIVKADTKYTNENGMRTIDIGEVVISGKKQENKEYRYSFYMPKNIPGIDILTSDKVPFEQYVNVSEILNRIPFIRTVEVDGEMKVIIDRMSTRMFGGSNYAAIIVDDMIRNDSDIDLVVDPANIERIAVLKGSQAILLGGDGAGGAIVITTKNGYSPGHEIPKYNIQKISPLGYQKPAEFYSPRYDTQQKRNDMRPDLRTTIYWNPNVIISTSGEAVFDFYTADASTTYSVVIEGVTSDGSIIQSISKISRK